MSGSDISNLSYKELQALALRYRVPGNIKKQLLIEVLQAARCGNEQEVDKLLADLRQTRKKRIRKGKQTKLSLASTPLHSPTYDMADDYYAAQHRMPYQWVGAEEEIPSRQDEANRVPQYEEFRQFLLRRIQRDYQTYNTNNNEKINPVDTGGIVDLSNETEDLRFGHDNPAGGMRTNIAPATNTLNLVQSYSQQIQTHNTSFGYQVVQDGKGNGHASILLRRMLQAPVGADLGVIASPELRSGGRIWGSSEYESQTNLLDNSDTLSANSDINGNDDNNNNWPIATEYYRFVNNVRDQLILNPTTCNIDDNPPHEQYQLLCSNDMQQNYNQQQWGHVPDFENDPLDCQKPKNYETKLFHGGSIPHYDNYAPVPCGSLENDPLHQQYPNCNEEGSTAYPAVGHQINSFDQANNNPSAASPRLDMKFYQNLKNHSATQGTLNTDVFSATHCHSTLIDRQNESITPDYNATGACDVTQSQTMGFVPPMQNLSFCNYQQTEQSPQLTRRYLDNLGATPSAETEQGYNRPSIFGQLIQGNERLYSANRSEERGSSVIANLVVDQDGQDQNRPVFGNTSTTQSDSTTSLEPFWPQRSGPNQTDLENILNLNSYGYVDYSKIDQTSCIYCYAAPIVTQKIFSAKSSCSQKRRFIAEFRQHTFSPYWLLYNDTKTGMQMSKHVKVIDKARDSVRYRSEKKIETNCVETLRSYKTEMPEHNMTIDNHMDLPGVSTQENHLVAVGNYSEFHLQDEQLLPVEIVEHNMSLDRCDGNEDVSTADSRAELQLASRDTLICNNRGVRQSSPSLNMDNTDQKERLLDEDYDN